MAKRCFYIGLFLSVLPFMVMFLEKVCVLFFGITGERLENAGAWGMFLACFIFLPGVMLTVGSGFQLLHKHDASVISSE